MKLRRFEIAVIAVTLVFAAFTAGYFTGRGSVDSVVTIGVQSGTDTASASVSADSAGAAKSSATDTGAEADEAAVPADSAGATGSAKPAEDTAAEGEAPAGSAGAAASEKLNLNTADAGQLEQLPGIGEVLAQRIVDYRAKNGGFRSAEELLNVSGIGEKKYEAIKDLVEVG